MARKPTGDPKMKFGVETAGEAGSHSRSLKAQARGGKGKP